jgi:hypothetical protein
VHCGGIFSQSRLLGEVVLVKRTNYKQEKRLKELEKQKKKEAKKERKSSREKEGPEGEETVREEELS